MYFVEMAGSRLTWSLTWFAPVGYVHAAPMSIDDKLKIVASSALQSLFASKKVVAPISAFDLLTRVIASGPPPSGLLPGPGPPPRFRLTDRTRFEAILESLAQSWDHGHISVSREEPDGGLTVMDVQLGTPGGLALGRKRKRVVDEDADSAAGDAEQEEEERFEQMRARMKPAPSTLASLSKDMRAVYNILQRSTAKGRLLAEQVRASLRLVHCGLIGLPVPLCERELRAHLRAHHEGRMRQGAPPRRRHARPVQSQQQHGSRPGGHLRPHPLPAPAPPAHGPDARALLVPQHLLLRADLCAVAVDPAAPVAPPNGDGLRCAGRRRREPPERPGCGRAREGEDAV